MISHPAAAAQQHLVPGRARAHRDWRQRACARRQGQALRRSGVEGAPPTGARAGLPGLGQRAPPLRGRRKIDKRDAERARFVVSLVVDAMSPTNSLAGNPAALKKLVDTGGASLVHGLENFVGDLVRNGGLPAQVDSGNSPSARIWQPRGIGRLSHPVMELIQYRPRTRGAQAAAADRPAADQQVLCLRPGARKEHRSVLPQRRPADLRHQLEESHAAESDFGLDTYVAALEEAVDVMRDITGSADVNIWGSCSAASPCRHFSPTRGARRKQVSQRHRGGLRARHGGAQNTTAGMFVTPESIVAAKSASQLAGVSRRQELARMFAWMPQRPDLELLGEQLPARQCAARFRRALLEQRHDAAARAAACRLPRSHRTPIHTSMPAG